MRIDYVGAEARTRVQETAEWARDEMGKVVDKVAQNLKLKGNASRGSSRSATRSTRSNSRSSRRSISKRKSDSSSSITNDKHDGPVDLSTEAMAMLRKVGIKISRKVVNPPAKAEGEGGALEGEGKVGGGEVDDEAEASNVEYKAYGDALIGGAVEGETIDTSQLLKNWDNVPAACIPSRKGDTKTTVHDLHVRLPLSCVYPFLSLVIYSL